MCRPYMNFAGDDLVLNRAECNCDDNVEVECPIHGTAYKGWPDDEILPQEF